MSNAGGGWFNTAATSCVPAATEEAFLELRVVDAGGPVLAVPLHAFLATCEVLAVRRQEVRCVRGLLEAVEGRLVLQLLPQLVEPHQHLAVAALRDEPQRLLRGDAGGVEPQVAHPYHVVELLVELEAAAAQLLAQALAQVLVLRPALRQLAQRQLGAHERHRHVVQAQRHTDAT